jgi:hypothetical protein
LALYNITYIRGIFPTGSFEESTQFGMGMHKLMGDSPQSQRILNMLEKGVMHAIKKKYAKTITFYITDPVLGPNDEENVLEEYAFKVRYGSRDGDVALDDITVRHAGGTAGDSAGAGADRTAAGAGTTKKGAKLQKLDDEEHIKKAAAKMVRTLVALITTLEPMPEESKFSMKLTYVDNTVRATAAAKPARRTAGKNTLDFFSLHVSRRLGCLARPSRSAPASRPRRAFPQPAWARTAHAASNRFPPPTLSPRSRRTTSPLSSRPPTRRLATAGPASRTPLPLAR